MMNSEQLEALEESARAWAEAHYPDASVQHLAAFTNAATYARFGFTGRFGGPSVREHVADQAWLQEVGEQGRATKSDEEIFAFLAPWIFGPIREQHIIFWYRQRDICFDDDPADAEELDAAVNELSRSKPGYANLRIWPKTQRKLNIVAALRNTSAVALLDILVSQELAQLHAVPGDGKHGAMVFQVPGAIVAMLYEHCKHNGIDEPSYEQMQQSLLRAVVQCYGESEVPHV